MQTLDVISVNIWQILISLLNLVLLFFILKKFLFKPVKNILAKRQSEIDSKYDVADQAINEAEQSRVEYEEKLSGAKAEADAILQTATDTAKLRGDKIVADAQLKADGIIRRAETEAELERKKAIDGIKQEIVSVSGAIAEKMIEREINTDDHRALIDSFIEEIGEDND
ncbi:MAG: F0F1 ATP synthase subunit B [Ruminococcaceae bacterium]|nr:F0F1 ATP synthase subunit B [Oscillospiraceae bacterium]